MGLEYIPEPRRRIDVTTFSDREPRYIEVGRLTPDAQSYGARDGFQQYRDDLLRGQREIEAIASSETFRAVVLVLLVLALLVWAFA